MEIANGASTTSRRPVRMATDLRSLQCHGSKVMLEDGRWYVDWQMGLHGALFGYGPDWWQGTLKEAAETGPASSIASDYARIVAGQLDQFYPGFDQVRFMCNGSDPCAAAVKLARAYTRRDRLLCYGYHGTASAYCPGPRDHSRPNLGDYPRNLGTLQAEREAYLALPWRSAEWPDLSLFAAVVVECPPVDSGRREWLYNLSTEARQTETLFVLDEVVTGFRYGPGGAMGHYNLWGKVDLLCLGKTLANGYPASALLGSREIMGYLAGVEQGQVHFSGTFFGEPIGMALASATLNQLAKQCPWQQLVKMGEALKSRWNKLSLPWKLDGHPTRPIIHPEPENNTLWYRFRRHMFNRGHIVVAHPWYVTTAVTVEDLDSLIEAAKEWRTP